MIKLKKILSWLKHYWYFPVVLVAIAIAFIVHRSKVEMLANLLVGSMESHKKEVDVINQKEEEKTKKIEAASMKHSEELQEIFTEETKALEDAQGKKDQRRKSLEELEMEMLAEEMRKAFKKE
jgi:hypothetical protein